MNQGGVAADQLRALVERIERLAAEKAELADDIKDVYAEAKANGYDTKVLRQVVRIRKQDAAERAEQEALLDLYLHALGMTVAERIARTEAETGQSDLEAAGDSDEARRARMAQKPGFGDGDPDLPEFFDRRKQAARTREKSTA